MNLDELLAKYSIKLETTAPGRYYTTCPECSASRSTNAHRAAKVLGVSIENDGRVCFGCNHCDFSGPKKGDGKGDGQRSDSFEATYDYRDADDAFQFQKVKNKPGAKNRFLCRRLQDGKWIWGLKRDTKRPLYRLPEILAVIKEGRTVVIAEGEKDCDNLWKIGLPATCNFDGTTDVIKNPKAKQKWKAEYSETLRGAEVVILNDNDPPGYAHADTIARMSVGICKRVRRLDLAPHWPQIPKGGDVSDWLVAGHTKDELEALIAAAPDYALQGDQNVPLDETAADAEVERLARFSSLEYQRARVAAAKLLGVTASWLDRTIKAKRDVLGLNRVDNKHGRPLEFPDIKPWPQPVNGQTLLDDLATAVRNHVIMEDGMRDTIALWVVHAFLLDHLFITPRLAITSPMKRCGKSTLIDVIKHLVPRPLGCESATTSAIYRSIELCRPTLLIDEATFLRDNDELRRILRSGHRRGGTTLRSVTIGEDYEPRQFATFAAVAFAFNGKLGDDELTDRSIFIRLRRRLPNENVTPFRLDQTAHLDELARKVMRWINDNSERFAALDPKMLAETYNREADNWRPLFAIAEAAGGNWPERVEAAAQAAHASEGDEGLMQVLLADIRDALRDPDDHEKPSDIVHATLNAAESYITSADLTEALVKLVGHPWAEFGRAGKPLSQHRLSRLLSELPVITQYVGPKDLRSRGYLLADFKEHFARYLGDRGDSKCTPVHQPANTGTSDDSKVFTGIRGEHFENARNPHESSSVNRCTLSKGGVAAQRAPSAPSGASHAQNAEPEPPQLCAKCGEGQSERDNPINMTSYGGVDARVHKRCEQEWCAIIDNELAQRGVWLA
jgi:hypothetical protein